MLKTKQKIALARLVQMIVMWWRSLIGLSALSQVKRSGVNWELDLQEGIDFSIWLLGAFEPETVRWYQRRIKAGDVVLDIGANIGAHTFFLAQSVGEQGQVIAFEPTDYAFSKLLKTASLNPELTSRIQAMQYMLVDAEDENSAPPSLYSSWPLKEEKDLHNLHQGRLMSTTEAKPKTLDSVVSSLKLDRVDYIKLDIDGFECGMLRGAKDVIQRWHPIIIMELAPYALEEQGASINELIQLLKEFGYAIYSMSSAAPIDMDATKIQTMIPPGASVNVIATSSSI